MLTGKAKEEGVVKCQQYYYVSLCSKLVNEGGWGQNPANVVYEWPLRGLSQTKYIFKILSFLPSFTCLLHNLM